MKQMSLIEMDGFLKGKCFPRDLKVNETNAEYLVRKFGELESKLETALRECRSAGITIDNLEAKCAKMAAENTSLKQSEKECGYFIDWPGVCHRRESIRTYAVNCNDAWLNTEGDDISGSYVKYKDHQEVVAALEAKCAALAAEHGIQIAINELLALAPRLDKRAVDALSVAVEHLCKLIKKEAVSEQN